MKYYDIIRTKMVYRPYVNDNRYCMADLDNFDFVLVDKNGREFVVATGEATDETKGSALRKYIITDVKTGLPFTEVHKYGELRPRDYGTPVPLIESNVAIKLQTYYLTLNNSLGFALNMSL